MRRLRILTWPTRPEYLRCLAQTPHDFLVLCDDARRSDHGDWPANVRAVTAAEARRQRLDLILFQQPGQYLDDQYELLGPAQRRVPKIYLEHEPPREHPVDSRHVVTELDVLVVHVTHFNRLMWDNGRSPTRVIEPGVMPSPFACSGELERGLAVIERVPRRRALGLDLVEQAKKAVSLDVALEFDAESAARYRYFFWPARYAAPNLAAIHAMMLGLPVVAPDAGGMATLVRHGIDGFLEADAGVLIQRMRELAGDRGRAALMGAAAREHALQRFGMARFVAEWNEVFLEATGLRLAA